MIGRNVKPIIRVKRGDTFKYKTINTKVNGVNFNSTGWKVRFIVRDEIPTNENNNNDAIIFKEMDGTASGKITLNITSEEMDIDAGSYYFECSVIKPDGSKHSSITGDLIVEGDLDRS